MALAAPFPAALSDRSSDVRTRSHACPAAPRPVRPTRGGVVLTARGRAVVFLLAVVALLAALRLQQAGVPPAQVVLIDCAQRTLDRKTKELLQTVVETALGADVPHIQAHVHLALQHGATPQEVLEALECVVAPMGVLAFRKGVAAWAAEVGLEPVDPVQT